MPQKSLSWDESEHPRDAAGEFAEKGTASPSSGKLGETTMHHAPTVSKSRGGYLVTVKGKKTGSESGYEIRGAQSPEHALQEAAKHYWNDFGEVAKPMPQEPADPALAGQRLMFDIDPNKTKRLFEEALVETTKQAKKKAPPKAPDRGPSLLEQIESDLKKTADASKPLGNQREFFSRMRDAIDRYAATPSGTSHQTAASSQRPAGQSKAKSSDGAWKTINGVHVYIVNGKITKGPSRFVGKQADKIGDQPPARKGQYRPASSAKSSEKPKPAGVDPTGVKPAGTGPAVAKPAGVNPANDQRPRKDIPIPDDIHFKEWDANAERAWKNFKIPNIRFKEWVETEEPQRPTPAGKSRKATIYESARQAAESSEVGVDDVLRMMPDAQKYLKQEQEYREKAKAELRRVSGLTAGNLARMENKYLDHSSLKNWDTTSREFVGNHPELGFNPDGDDVPALLWDFLREGKARYISSFDPKVAELAAIWAMPTKLASGRLPGDEDDSHRQASPARDDEPVPFSRRISMLAEKFSRIFKNRSKLPLRTF